MSTVPVVDIREASAGEPSQDGTDTVRVPSAEETADTIQRAQRALAELDQRRADDERRAAEHAREEELTRWRTDEIARATERPARVQHEPVLVD